MATSFTKVYNTFLDKITDDMQMELTPEDTMKDLRRLLVNGIPEFEFPRVVLTNYTIETETIPKSEASAEDFIIDTIYSDDDQVEDEVVIEHSYFEADLSPEEINILALIVMCGWLQRQVTSIENTRMKYSGNDFKMTSQANHLSKLLSLLAECQRQSFHMQRLYRRRKFSEDGSVASNWSCLREVSALDDEV